MVIVFFGKGCESIVHTLFYNGMDITGELARKAIDNVLERIPEALYYEFFDEKEYNVKFK
ncbi:MAG: hypothetical protein IKU29_06240 [Parabacteroides sp.]|nr:hypothetical protein [Parabacteroides sp.]